MLQKVKQWRRESGEKKRTGERVKTVSPVRSKDLVGEVQRTFAGSEKFGKKRAM